MQMNTHIVETDYSQHRPRKFGTKLPGAML